MIGPWDGRQFSRVTSGVRFCLWAVLCGHAPLPKAVLCVGRFLRGCLADKYVGRLSLWSALCPPPLLMLFLFLLVILLSFDPLMYKDWFHTSVLRVLGMGVGWGGGPWDNQQFGRATFGVRFCAVGRALRSCPATKVVLCVGRFLRGCLADKYVGWLSLWSALCPPPPSAHAFSLPSSHSSVLPIGYKRLLHGIHC